MVIDVPGTCANLGPGFDAVAVAVDLCLRVWTVDRTDDRVAPGGEGAGELPTVDENLVWRALVAYCEWSSAPVPDVSLRTRNELPLERGLGSSAAAAVAGAALGRALTGAGGRDQDLVDLAAQLEGHPDNAAAAVLGGLAVCTSGRAYRIEPTDALRPVLCVPDTRQSTTAARGVLPSTVSLADAAANGARAALVVAGLAGVVAWEPAAMVDVLHEPARLEVMAASGALIADLRAEGIAACLSGAGPTVLAITAGGDDAAVERIRRRAGGGWRVVGSHWNRSGASVGTLRP